MFARELEKNFVAELAKLGIKCPKSGYPWPSRIVLRKNRVDFVYILGPRPLTVSETQTLYFLRLTQQNVVFIRTVEDIHEYVQGWGPKPRKTAVVFDQRKLF